MISLVHVQAPAGRVAALVKERSADPDVQVTHCARLLTDEDEMVREFAWGFVEAWDAASPAVARNLEDIARQTYEPGLARRAAGLLAGGVPAVRASRTGR